MNTFEKRRTHAPPGSIPAVLGMFSSEVRFYREVASEVGVRVPVCVEASDTELGTYLQLEDLSSWSSGADPVGVAALLRTLHQRWEGRALDRWPWLRLPGAGADLIGALYDRTWRSIAARSDVTSNVRALGEFLVGQVEAAEHIEGQVGPLTLCHGDTSMKNLATSPDGEIVFFDWEDVRFASGVTDLAWFLVSSVPPEDWDDVAHAYGSRDYEAVLPSVAAQGLLALSGEGDGSAAAADWVSRLSAAAKRIGV